MKSLRTFFKMASKGERLNDLLNQRREELFRIQVRQIAIDSYARQLNEEILKLSQLKDQYDN